MTHRGRKTFLYIVVGVAVVAFAIAAVLFYRKQTAPRAVRLLPDSDAIVYIDLQTIRRLTSLNEQPSPPHDPDYEQFVRETGFQFERDLDEAAFAVHTAGPAGEKRYSEIFLGHYDTAKVSAYLKRISTSTERYNDKDIYSIPVENRTVRVALLGVDSAAISNLDDPAVIHGMVDRYGTMALPHRGPAIVQNFYKHVPLGSLMWALVRIPPAPQDPRAARSITLPGGIDIFIPSASTMVGSIRVLTSVNAKAEFFTSSEADAKHFVEQAGAFLNLFRAIQSSAQLSGSDADVKAVFDSIQIEQDKERAVISASVPVGFLKKVVSESPAQITGPEEPQAVQPQAVPEQKQPEAPAKKTQKDSGKSNR